MNRAERRRRARVMGDVHNTDQAHLLVGSDHIYPADQAKGRMPAKQPGAHRWVMIGTWTVADPGAQGPKLFDVENLISAHVGCIDCEQQYSDRTAAAPCPAGDEWR